MPRLHRQMSQIMPDFSRTPGGESTYGCSIPLCKKVNFRCIATTMRAEIRGAGRYFWVMAGAKYHCQALISCRAELVVSSITITIAIARREAAEKFPVPSADLHWLTSYYRGASTMQPDQLLVPCPKCHAWPMAVHAGKRKWASDAPMVRFTCAKCGHQEEERLGGPYTKRESSQQHEIAGGGF